MTNLERIKIGTKEEIAEVIFRISDDRNICWGSESIEKFLDEEAYEDNGNYPNC